MYALTYNSMTYNPSSLRLKIFRRKHIGKARTMNYKVIIMILMKSLINENLNSMQFDEHIV